ncbi:hypothetical protein CHLRE_08g373374v5 [Chlamydomonas reinhardtii]|uniref:Uncharacterized protein n=1 Tax=Chlamydomonas reinhardtii TaxID=3055 RepID=A0A2K3DHI5_CHLRE|nr:uncharacterized protein CHLRE_08g373374v5 [Chlamydomonas reinhardtii]PNW79981.1 hypothetical protein CHLRE_08g373374v5 [Chlamydomonas reinhardtii]
MEIQSRARSPSTVSIHPGYVPVTAGDDGEEQPEGSGSGGDGGSISGEEPQHGDDGEEQPEGSGSGGDGDSISGEEPQHADDDDEQSEGSGIGGDGDSISGEEPQHGDDGEEQPDGSGSDSDGDSMSGEEPRQGDDSEEQLDGGGYDSDPMFDEEPLQGLITPSVRSSLLDSQSHSSMGTTANLSSSDLADMPGPADSPLSTRQVVYSLLELHERHRIAKSELDTILGFYRATLPTSFIPPSIYMLRMLTGLIDQLLIAFCLTGRERIEPAHWYIDFGLERVIKEQLFRDERANNAEVNVGDNRLQLTHEDQVLRGRLADRLQAVAAGRVSGKTATERQDAAKTLEANPVKASSPFSLLRYANQQDLFRVPVAHALLYGVVRNFVLSLLDGSGPQALCFTQDDKRLMRSRAARVVVPSDFGRPYTDVVEYK